MSAYFLSKVPFILGTRDAEMKDPVISFKQLKSNKNVTNPIMNSVPWWKYPESIKVGDLIKPRMVTKLSQRD